MGAKQESDIIGNVYERLEIISFSHKEKNKSARYKYYYNCKCSCGNDKIIERRSIMYGNTKSCGCIHKEGLIKRNKDNNIYGNDSIEFEGLYNSWIAMKNRCDSPKNKKYEYYGGKGIKVYSDWYDWFKFKEWALDNGWESGLTIERADIKKNYEPLNCTWVTQKEQANNKSNNKYIKYKGETKTLSRWCEELDLNYDRIKARINACHWSVEDAFEKEKYATQKGL